MNLYPLDDPPTYPQRFVHPRDSWAAVKQTDGLGGEWTCQVFIHRALNFHMSTVPPLWAEPLSSFDALWQEAWFKSHAMNAGVSQARIGLETATFPSFPFRIQRII